MSTETKVRMLVKSALPQGKRFQLRWQPVGFGGYRVLRVVTPAWRSLPRLERILKLQSAITEGLSPRERADILRVSVLTFRRVQETRSTVGTAPFASRETNRATP